MKNTIKISLAVMGLLILVAGIRIGLIYKQRNEVEHPKETVATHTSADQLVHQKRLYPSSMADIKTLIGKPLWVSAASQMDYYPYSTHHADYHHTSGTLLGAQRMDIKDAFEQIAPKDVATRIPTGDRQVLLAFTLPGDTKEYAVPVGDQEGKLFNFYVDEVFFYDDPHQMYSFWGKDIWAAIDRHEAIKGMSERQAEMALGQVVTPEGSHMGNRGMTFYNLGKHVHITFVDDKATEITPVNK